VGRTTLEVVIMAETMEKGTTGVKGEERARTRTRGKEREREREREREGRRREKRRERGKRKMLVAVIGYEVERRWREREGQRCNHRDGDAGKGSGGEWQIGHVVGPGAGGCNWREVHSRWGIPLTDVF